MKSKITVGIRVLLGILFFGSGVAGLFNLIPPPTDLPEPMLAFVQGLMATKYFFPLLKCTEIICGLLLITGRFVPLALVVLAPIVLNIFFVHALLEPKGLPMAIGIGLATVYLSFFAQPYSATIKLLFRK